MLLDYLEPPGRYDGLDILPAQIKFAQDNIHSLYPHFHFHLADVYNREYYPEGKQRADTYKFPFDDSSFDIVYAASLFTHLVPADAVNYLKESCRVLRKGGRCLLSFFLLDYFRGQGTATRTDYDVQHSLAGANGVGIHNPKNPEWMIAYKISLIEQFADEAGLAIRQIIPGFWSGTHAVGINEQDLVLFERT